MYFSPRGQVLSRFFMPFSNVGLLSACAISLTRQNRAKIAQKELAQENLPTRKNAITMASRSLASETRPTEWLALPAFLSNAKYHSELGHNDTPNSP